MQTSTGCAAGIQRTLCFVALLIAFISTSTSAQVNSWTKPTSGSWDDSSAWSLGVLPNGSQSVLITNFGWKAVAINPSTPINFPESMTVDSLTIQGAWDTKNTLLLNYAGTDVPLTVLNGLTLQDSAQIVNFNSALVVQGGAIVVTNAQIVQDGGLTRTTGAQMNLSDSVYNLTNGFFEGGSVSLGYPASAHFNQYGGSVIITNLGFASYIAGTNYNGYSLYGGTLDLPGGMFLLGEAGGVSYFQAGGTNRTTQVTIEPDYGGHIGGFTLNGGLLADSGVQLMAGYRTPVSIEQSGGTHVITNTLLIVGSSPNGYSVDPATYNLNGGTLCAGVIELSATDGDSVFVQQSNSTTCAGTVYAHSLGYFSSHNTIMTLASGTLSCSNFTTVDGGGRFNQNGGALVVSNLLDFGGSRNVGPIIYGRYTFTGGTVTASNISITGDMIIGDGSTNRISNPGFFTLSHTLQIGNAVEQLGRFILTTNATIDLSGEASKLSFANSSAEVWNGAAKLIVVNWNWLTSENYLGDQLKFGTNQYGLTAAQLQRIHFINPAGYSPGDYAAQILSTGEVWPSGPASGDFTNDWTGADGNWHDLTWSLGVRPDSSQTVRIIGGDRTVTVNATTTASYPESLTVHDLVVRGLSGTPSLLLSNAGTATPLRAINGLFVADGAKLVNLNSGLVLDGAVLTLTNAQIIQNGGFVRTTNATMYLQNGVYQMTNGVLEGGIVSIGAPTHAQFNQYGGEIGRAHV